VECLAFVTPLRATMWGSVLFGLAVGYYLDEWVHSRGVFTAVFIVLGIVGGGVTVYRQIQKIPME